MRNLASAELNDSLHAIAFPEEPDGMVLLEIVIVIVGVGTKLQFLHLNYVLLFSGIVLLFLIFVLPLAVIHGLGNRGLRSRSDEDEIEAEILGFTYGRRSRHDFHHAIRKDGANFSGTDCFVNVFADSGTTRREISGWQHQLVTGKVPAILRCYQISVNPYTGYMKVSEIARRLGCSVHGDAEREIRGVAGIESAGPEELTFLANPRYAARVKDTRAAAILVSKPADRPDITSLVSGNPYLDFARALAMFYTAPQPAPGVHPMASVDASAHVGDNASVGAFAVVGPGVTIGRNAVLHPHVVIYEGARIGDDFLAHSHASVREFCVIGDRVILQNGVVVGGDGFGFAKRADGSHEKIVQSGITVVEDDAEIQSLTSVDRATIGETRVKRGAKVDSLVQVGHACVIGEDNIICAQTGLAGSSVLGKNVLLAGQTGISGHLTIHDNAVVYAQSGVGGDVKAGAVISGSPAFDAREWLRAITSFQRLPELLRTVRQLEKKVRDLEARLTS